MSSRSSDLEFAASSRELIPTVAECRQAQLTAIPAPFALAPSNDLTRRHPLTVLLRSYDPYRQACCPCPPFDLTDSHHRGWFSTSSPHCWKCHGLRQPDLQKNVGASFSPQPNTVDLPVQQFEH